MLHLKPSSYVKNAHLLKSEYAVKDGKIIANLDAPLILDMVLRFLYINKDKALSFYLETPDNLKAEADFTNDSTPKNPMFAFNASFESFEKASGVLFFFSEILAKDGLCRYKFRADNDEIYCEKYNIVTITCEDTEKYGKLLCDMKIPRTDNLVTAYDTFSKETPGMSKRVFYKGMSAKDLPQLFRQYGFTR